MTMRMCPRCPPSLPALVTRPRYPPSLPALVTRPRYSPSLLALGEQDDAEEEEPLADRLKRRRQRQDGVKAAKKAAKAAAKAETAKAKNAAKGSKKPVPKKKDAAQKDVALDEQPAAEVIPSITETTIFEAEGTQWKPVATYSPELRVMNGKVIAWFTGDQHYIGQIVQMVQYDGSAWVKFYADNYRCKLALAKENYGTAWSFAIRAQESQEDEQAMPADEEATTPAAQDNEEAQVLLAMVLARSAQVLLARTGPCYATRYVPCYAHARSAALY